MAESVVSKTVATRPPVCPNCGSDEIGAWERVSQQSGLACIEVQDGVRRFAGGREVSFKGELRPEYDSTDYGRGDFQGDNEEYRCRSCDYASDRLADFLNGESTDPYLLMPSRERPFGDDFVRQFIEAIDECGALRVHREGSSRLGLVYQAAKAFLATEDAEPAPNEGVWIGQEQLAELLAFFYATPVTLTKPDPANLHLTRGERPTHLRARVIGASDGIELDRDGERIDREEAKA